MATQRHLSPYSHTVSALFIQLILNDKVSSDTENASMSLRECERPVWREGQPPPSGLHTHAHAHDHAHTRSFDSETGRRGLSVVESSVDGTM